MCAVQCNRPNHTEQRRNRDWITIPPNTIQTLIVFFFLLSSLYAHSPLTHSTLFRSKCTTKHKHTYKCIHSRSTRHQEMNVRFPFQQYFRCFSFQLHTHRLMLHIMRFVYTLFASFDCHAQLLCGHSIPLLLCRWRLTSCVCDITHMHLIQICFSLVPLFWLCTLWL